MFDDLIKSDEEPRIPVGSVEVGKDVCITVDLQAPFEPGRYISSVYINYLLLDQQFSNSSTYINIYFNFIQILEINR
jgi:hypothetical protein